MRHFRLLLVLPLVATAGCGDPCLWLPPYHCASTEIVTRRDAGVVDAGESDAGPAEEPLDGGAEDAG